MGRTSIIASASVVSRVSQRESYREQLAAFSAAMNSSAPAEPRNRASWRCRRSPYATGVLSSRLKGTWVGSAAGSPSTRPPLFRKGNI